jgi:hypothetical protein
MERQQYLLNILANLGAWFHLNAQKSNQVNQSWVPNQLKSVKLCYRGIDSQE